MWRSSICREMGREAPLRGPVQTFGGYVLCLGPPEITTALTFIEQQGLSRCQGLMPSSSAQELGACMFGTNANHDVS